MILKKILKFFYLNLISNYLKLVLFTFIKKKIKLNDKFTKHLLFKGFLRFHIKKKYLPLFFTYNN